MVCGLYILAMAIHMESSHQVVKPVGDTYSRKRVRYWISHRLWSSQNHSWLDTSLCSMKTGHAEWPITCSSLCVCIVRKGRWNVYRVHISEQYRSAQRHLASRTPVAVGIFRYISSRYECTPSLAYWEDVLRIESKWFSAILSRNRTTNLPIVSRIVEIPQASLDERPCPRERRERIMYLYTRMNH